MPPDNSSPDFEVASLPTSTFNPPQTQPDKVIPRRSSTTFSALQNKNYRLFWSGAFVSNIGNWMQTIAQNWLVLSLTHSPFMLGLVNFIGNIPMIALSLYGGVLADRNSRKRVLFITQTGMLVLVLAMAILTALNIINIWLILIIVLGIGVVQAFNAPAYQTIMQDLVGKEQLMNAIALNSLQFNLSRVIGPSIAGVLVVILGVAACFFINALSFGAVLLALFLIQIPAVKNPRQKKSAFTDIGESIRYLKADPALLGLLGLSTAFSIFIFPYLSLLSVFAKDEFNSQADGYGILMAGVGIGAVGGALVVARLSETKKRIIFLEIGSVAIVVTMLFFSFAPRLWLSLPFLSTAGGGMVALQSSINTIIQTGVPDAMRGRIISMWQLTGMGLLPVGSLLGGTVAEWAGARVAVGGGAVIFGIIALSVYFFIPSTREF